MKTVIFNSHYTPYAKGDVAGIEDKLADHLIKERIASPYTSEDKSDKKPSPDEGPDETSKAEKKSADAPEVNKMTNSAQVKK